MRNMKSKIEAIKNSILKVDNEEYKHIFNNVLSVLNDMSYSLEELNIRQESLEESIQYIDKDITGIQEELFEEVTIEDLIEMDDEFTEINCKHCNKQLFVEKESINNNKPIPCPFCHNNAI
jgi:NAD-dependent SIR2 family protein deacetylase